jgi:signal transduction histidine kinase
VGMALFYLIQGFRKSTSPQNRNRIGYLLGAVVVWIVFMATNFNRDLANYSVDHLGNIANALIISYAILRFQLLNIKFVMRRGLAYFIVAVCLLGAYVGVILLEYRFLPDQPLVVMLLIASVVTLSLAFLARPLRYTIQEWVDRVFYRGTYQYRQTLINFSRKMGNIINLDTLASEMLPTISKALRVPNAKLLLKDSSSGDFTTQFTYPKEKDEPGNELRLSPDHPIVAQMENEVSPLDLKQIDSIHQLKGLWETEKEQLLVSDLELLCPIKSRGNLIGILALGKKRADTTYSHEDIELITSMANQAGIIIENAMMLDTLEKQQAQVEHLLAQVVQVQEEERRRISVDLHDSVAQWLVAASYRAQSFSQALSKDNGEMARDELSNMEDTLNKSLKELRRVVIGLRPPALDELGLSHALRQSLEELKTDGLDCKFTEIGTTIRPPSNVEIAIYRIVQEALSNIRRHSDASKVNLSLQFQKDGLLVEIRDNGKGFDLHQTLRGAVSVGHMGLLGMRQRAEMLGGDFRIKSKEGAGTTIILSLPIQPQIEEE